MMSKPSFFQRLTGAAETEQYEDFFEDTQPQETAYPAKSQNRPRVQAREAEWQPEPQDGEGELAVDVYQTADSIVVKALVAGVQPQTIDISLTREMLTISGIRTDEREVDEDNYFQRELYWGSFSRTILLPEEVDVERAEASEKHGILMIRLPKINKKRETKLKVRAR